jgi:hypothetical protein
VDAIPAEPDTHHTHGVTCKTRVTDESHRCAGISKHQKKIDMKRGGKKLTFAPFFFLFVFVDFEERDFGRRRPAANDSIFHARFQKKKTVRKVRFLVCFRSFFAII